MWSFLKPEPHRPLLSKEKIDPTYKRLRWQVFIGIFIGYAGYYLVRKNFWDSIKGFSGLLFQLMLLPMDCLSLLWVGFQTVVVPVNSCPWG